jgi:CO/xanthine dehydrogenase Mo-binding subunit
MSEEEDVQTTVSQKTIDDERVITGAPLDADEARTLAAEIGSGADHDAQASSAGYVGTSVHRYGGDDRLTGAQKFVSDLRFTDAAQVSLVTLPVAVATITGIDTTRAEAMPGVVAVVSAQDLPQPVPRFGVSHQDRPVLADGEVLYHGEPVVAVVADTLDQAEDAARAVEIEFEERAGAFDLDQALAPDAPLVRDPALRPDDDEHRGSNVLETALYEWGDTTRAADEADVVVENTYTFPMVTHFPIEPGGTVAVPQDDGGLEIYSPVQHPYLLQRTIAKVIGLPLAKVRVFAPDPGGGFGGKQNPKLEPLLAFLALRTGRACRLVLSLEQTFQMMRRAACRVRARTGFGRDGSLVFHELDCDYLIGAYADVAPRVMTKGSYVGAGPYRIPHVRTASRAVMSHTTPSTAFRGFGCPQVAWATESQLDAGARELGLDALAIRRRNLVQHGEAFFRGPYEALADGQWHESLEKAAELIGWDTPLAPHRGRGIAVAIKPGATSGLSQSLVRFLADGSAIAYAGTSDMGQGARTLWQQILADELGAPLDRIRVVSGDTGVVPFDLQTSASRSTVFMGNAVLEACRDIRRRILSLYAEFTGTDEGELSERPGELLTPEGPLPLMDAARIALGALGGEFVGQGTSRMRGRKGHPLGGDAAFYEFNCTAIEVEVDTATGELLVHKHVSVSDVGTELNPAQVTSQDEGASIMGLGHSQMEQLLIDEHGVIRNLGALDYRIPTFKDVPVELVTHGIENHDGPGPYGSKGISEGALLCTAGALGSAVNDAIGCVVRDLPLTPERVWTALQEQAAEAPPTLTEARPARPPGRGGDGVVRRHRPSTHTNS